MEIDVEINSCEFIVRLSFPVSFNLCNDVKQQERVVRLFVMASAQLENRRTSFQFRLI